MNTSSTDAPVRVGLIGYGLGGKVFHAPLYAAAGVELVAVASSDAAKVQADFPGMRVHATPEALLADATVELVDIASPSPTHAPLALAALAAGKHVLCDKPFATSVAEADAIIAAGEAAGRTVSCFQNRRRDADFLTCQRLIDDGTLGEVISYEARFDRWAPAIRDRWQERDGPGVGIHYDLGAHLIDQALTLFGMPDAVQGELLRLRPDSDIIDTMHARLAYPGGRRITLAATLSALDNALRFRVQGRRAAWLKSHLDPQEDQLRFQGLSPDDARYGREPDEHHGTLLTLQADGRTSETRTPSERGDWPSFYRELAAAIRTGAPPPVTARQARNTIAVIEAIAASSEAGRPVEPR